MDTPWGVSNLTPLFTEIDEAELALLQHLINMYQMDGSTEDLISFIYSERQKLEMKKYGL